MRVRATSLCRVYGSRGLRAVVALLMASLGLASAPTVAEAAGGCSAPDSSGLVVCTFDGNAGTAPGAYTLAVPAGSPDFAVAVFGAQGGSSGRLPTGMGAEAEAQFTTPPGGSTLSLTVAGAGGTGMPPNGGPGYAAGGPGGVPGNNNITQGAGGGGSSAVASGATLLAEAGGGGGAGSDVTGAGEDGGNAGAAGTAGVQGPGSQPGAGGAGATISSPGSGSAGGACNGQSGVTGTQAGGSGGGRSGNFGGGPGGGGGGGYFGGGGGGQGGWCPPPIQNISAGGGGGGGSSYVSPSASSSTIIDGANAPQAGNGKIIVSYPMPVGLTSFTPGSGHVGTSVTLTGSGFTWAASVTFDGVAAGFTIVSDTEITAMVPSGALSGAITVANGAGASATSTSSFLVKPAIGGFSPRSGPPGASVTIKGTAFTGASKVTFDGVAASFSVGSYGQITATVPAGATTGPIGITTPAGKTRSKRAFTVT